MYKFRRFPLSATSQFAIYGERELTRKSTIVVSLTEKSFRHLHGQPIGRVFSEGKKKKCVLARTPRGYAARNPTSECLTE